MSKYPKTMKIPITFTEAGEKRWRSQFRNIKKLPKYKTVWVYDIEEEKWWLGQMIKDKLFARRARKMERLG